MMTSKNSGKPTVKELDTRVQDLHSYFNSELKKFRSEISKVKTPESIIGTGDDEVGVETFVQKFSFFEATIKNELQKLQRQVTALKMESEKIQCKLDDSVQYQFRNRLLMHGLEEKAGGDLYSEVKNIFKNKLDIHIEKTDVNICYRFGKKRRTTDKRTSRPVLLEFVNLWMRNEVYYKKKLLKGTNLLITEYLSPHRYEVYKIVKSRFGKECWTKNCAIGFQYGNTLHYVTTLEQYSNVCGAVPQSENQLNAGRSVSNATNDRAED